MKLFTGSRYIFLQSSVNVKKMLIRNLRSVWGQSNDDSEGPVGYDTNIEMYNCVAKRKIPLIIKNKELATWYTCGPTIYDSAHIGHASCYLKLDIIQRILREHFGITLVTAMNITDIDDKIIAKCLEMKTDWRTLTNAYEKEFWNDLKQLNCKLPDVRLRVTDNISNICKFIEKLIGNDWAYPVSDGSVYFNVKKYTKYGKLQNIHIDGDSAINPNENDDNRVDIRTNLNVIDEHHQSGKKSIQDFALWKSVKNLTDTPNWSSPWGNGRPGWHIECSTLATMVFGNEMDFHAGGIDLRFPHHENEETQSCAFHCRPQWVNYWIHTGHLHVTGHSAKMSKSLKNTISITQLLSVYSADTFRMTCCLSNYRNRMEYNDDVMKLSEGVLKRFLNFLMDSENYVNGQRTLEPIINNRSTTIVDLYKLLDETKLNVHKYLCDDFNTSKMIEILLILVTETNKFINPPSTLINSDTVLVDSELDFWASNDLTIIKCIHNYIKLNLNLLGFIMCTGENLQSTTHDNTNDKNTKTEEIINDLIKLRMDVREMGMDTKNKQFFELSDKIRKLLLSNGIEIKDHGKLSTWKFK